LCGRKRLLPALGAGRRRFPPHNTARCLFSTDAAWLLNDNFSRVVTVSEKIHPRWKGRDIDQIFCNSTFDVDLPDIASKNVPNHDESRSIGSRKRDIEPM